MNPYEELNIARDATAATIKRAYKKMAQQFHPDRCLDDEIKVGWTARFQRIKEAYEILSDEARRAAYDQTGSTEQTNEQSETLGCFRSHIQAGVNLWMGRSGYSLIECVKMSLDGALREVVTAVGKHRSGLDKLRTGRTSLKRRAEGADVLGDMLEHLIEQTAAEILRMEAQTDRLRRVQAMLAEYGVDGPPAAKRIAGNFTHIGDSTSYFTAS